MTSSDPTAGTAEEQRAEQVAAALERLPLVGMATGEIHPELGDVSVVVVLSVPAAEQLLRDWSSR